MLMDVYRLSFAELVCYDNEDLVDDPGQGSATNQGNGSDTNESDSQTGKGSKDKVFYQEDVDRIVEQRLARERKAQEQRHRELESQYVELLENKNLNDAERAKLEESLEDVRKRMRTKEEQAKIEIKQLQDQHEQKLTEAQQKAQYWETQYRDSSIARSLQDAAVSHEAYNANQIVNLLKPMTKLVEDVDESGKSTGQYKPVVDFPDQDDEGNPIVTQRTPEETVQRMKELPDYANLFKSNVVSGLGSNSATGGGAPGSNGQIDVRKLTPEQYMKIRREQPGLLGLD